MPSAAGDPGPRRFGLLWWAGQLGGLLVALALMAPLAYALMVLTRMPVEGETEPDFHALTFWVWFLLCTASVLWTLGRQTWRTFADEQVHLGAHGELRINRWSPAHERERFHARRVADARRVGPGAGTAPTPSVPSRGEEMTSEELRAAAKRRREVGPGVSGSVRLGWRGAGLARWLRRAAITCAVAFLPVTIGAAYLLDAFTDLESTTWGLWGFVLLPLAWVLQLGHHVVGHRGRRSRRSRSDLAWFVLITASITAVLGCLVGFVAVVDREFLRLALPAVAVGAAAGWLARRESRHAIPVRGGHEGDHANTMNAIDSVID